MMTLPDKKHFRKEFDKLSRYKELEIEIKSTYSLLQYSFIPRIRADQKWNIAARLPSYCIGKNEVPP